MEKVIYRQGDVLLVKVERYPKEDEVSWYKTESSTIVAEGEATGHAHVLDGPAVMLSGIFSVGESRRQYVVVDDPGARIIHEEHGSIDLEAGVYLVRNQREYTPARELWVRD